LLKARSKKISLVLVLAMLMTMFAGLGTASAASTYDEVIVQTVNATKVDLDKAKFAINVPDVAALHNGSLLTVHLPSGIKLNNDNLTPKTQKVTWDGTNYMNVVTQAVYSDATAGTADVNVTAPEHLPDGKNNALYRRIIAYAVGQNAFEIQVLTAPASGVGLIYVEFQNAYVDSTFDGDIYANILTPDGSGFTPKSVRIAKYISGKGGTQTFVNSVVSMGEGTKTLEPILIQETIKNSIEPGEKIKLKLPAGFKWVSAGTVTGAWAFSGLSFTADPTQESGRSLVITAPAAGLGSLSSEGRIYISGAQITVSDVDVAKKGDVIVTVSSNLGNVTDQEVVVASYKDYDVVVEAAKEVEVLAGRDDVTLGDIKITENLAGSILNNRTIKLTLPNGVKWHVDSNPATNDWPDIGVNPFTFESVSGDITLAALGGMPTTTTNNGRTITLTVGSGPYSKSEFLLKKLKVTIAPDFSGDLNVEVGGTAGVTGTVKVATVKPPVELITDGKAELIIGAQAQEAGDIIIREAAKEAIDATAATTHLTVRLPEGAKWYSKPKVEVTEGDIAIDKVDTDSRDLKINFKASSTKASEIKISDVKITLDRNVPEGDLKITIPAAVSNAVAENAGPTKFDVSTIVSAVLAQCVTPAPGEIVESGQFRIGSNIYYAGGVAKVMDVAPYIKDSRTYVPMRYLGEILGAEVVWDDAARTVTLTKDETTVVFTIGSTTYTVNGEAKTADVAPEITNDRTMLPARFVAEAFGAVVGWDAATQTVLITK
jgi:hypothetical protein